MTTTINEAKTISLIDGTTISVRPLRISLLRDFMDKFEKIAEVAEDNAKSMNLLMECVQIALKQYKPEIADLLYQEGFADFDEPYDSIGGHSVNDLKRAFAKTKGRDEELGEGWDDFTQKKRYPKDYEPENYRSIPKDFFRKNLGHKIDSEGTKLSRRQEKPFDDYEDFDDEELV